MLGVDGAGRRDAVWGAAADAKWPPMHFNLGCLKANHGRRLAKPSCEIRTLRVVVFVGADSTLKVIYEAALAE